MYSITQSEEVADVIQRSKEEDPRAIECLFEECFPKLVAYANQHMGDLPKGDCDEEDIAICSFQIFIRGAVRDQFPKLENEDDLWKLLYTITNRQINKTIRKRLALKRGGRSSEKTPFANLYGVDLLLSRIRDRRPRDLTSEGLPIDCTELLDKLQDKILRRIAVMKLYGYTNAELAEKLQCAERSVERKIRKIRSIWQALQ